MHARTHICMHAHGHACMHAHAHPHACTRKRAHASCTRVMEHTSSKSKLCLTHHLQEPPLPSPHNHLEASTHTHGGAAHRQAQAGQAQEDPPAAHQRAHPRARPHARPALNQAPRLCICLPNRRWYPQSQGRAARAVGGTVRRAPRAARAGKDRGRGTRTQAAGVVLKRWRAFGCGPSHGKVYVASSGFFYTEFTFIVGVQDRCLLLHALHVRTFKGCWHSIRQWVARLRSAACTSPALLRRHHLQLCARWNAVPYVNSPLTDAWLHARSQLDHVYEDAKRLCTERDAMRPFTSMHDALERLLPFHVRDLWAAGGCATNSPGGPAFVSSSSAACSHPFVDV